MKKSGHISYSSDCAPMVGIDISITSAICNKDALELVMSLLEQLKAKDEQLHTMDEHISSLTKKLVGMSIELASSKASEDEHCAMLLE